MKLIITSQNTTGGNRFSFRGALFFADGRNVYNCLECMFSRVQFLISNIAQGINDVD